ncbi:hypothetical protein FOA52_002722 [Chlamydomonas sp. UWO 241]|nr:hypothetical protein FOA52_002722 [Chlamydomonas sp. UWO 241]
MDPAALSWSLCIRQTEALIASRSKELTVQRERQRIAEVALKGELEKQHGLEHHLAQLDADVATEQLAQLEQHDTAIRLEEEEQLAERVVSRLQEEVVAATGRASCLRDMVQRETEKAETTRQEVAAHEARGPHAEATAKLKAKLQEIDSTLASTSDRRNAQQALRKQRHEGALAASAARRAQLEGQCEAVRGTIREAEHRAATVKMEAEQQVEAQGLRQRLAAAANELAGLKRQMAGNGAAAAQRGAS